MAGQLKRTVNNTRILKECERNTRTHPLDLVAFLERISVFLHRFIRQRTLCLKPHTLHLVQVLYRWRPLLEEIGNETENRLIDLKMDRTKDLLYYFFYIIIIMQKKIWGCCYPCELWAHLLCFFNQACFEQVLGTFGVNEAVSSVQSLTLIHPASCFPNVSSMLQVEETQIVRAGKNMLEYALKP